MVIIKSTDHIIRGDQTANGSCLSFTQNEEAKRDAKKPLNGVIERYYMFEICTMSTDTGNRVKRDAETRVAQPLCP